MFQITTEIHDNRVADLICSAFEGGSNYWYKIDYSKSVKPEPEKLFKWDIDTDEVFRHVQWPLSEGGRLWVTNTEGDEYEGFLDRESLQKGLNVMAEKYPRHFSDFIQEHDDANTGDVFLQCCLFGEVIYG